MPDPFQQTIKRRREERVHLIYEVETLGQIQQVELPYIVGVMADLSGQPETDLPPLREREFLEIDQKTFDKVLEGAAPHLAFTVPNRLTGGGQPAPHRPALQAVRGLRAGPHRRADPAAEGTPGQADAAEGTAGPDAGQAPVPGGAGSHAPGRREATGPGRGTGDSAPGRNP